MAKVLYHRRELVTPPVRTPEEQKAWEAAKEQAKAAFREKEKAARRSARASKKEAANG